MAKPVSQRGFARDRVIEAALHLFAERGVNGTSLQMIADHLGVRKAAIYYQFHTKDDIVLAVVRPVFDDMERLVRIAESISSAESRRDAAISGFVELAVRHRRIGSMFYGDPAVLALVQSHREFEAITDSLRELLIGTTHDAETRVTIGMITSGIFGSTAEPHLQDIADQDLHRILLDCAQRMLQSSRPAAEHLS
ncbi:TetR/AcrR family transcriptional regulator [Mycolicibacterium bacteremicum]|uniref:TetR family transcriptional regulator n=1 Tax=Mycolicibacterium bacteremicum TaxID=564198 RepID=A0A1W9YTL8_MYCBA|nr:TetR/AcrR family transcriptional regulator [Mycolicibacterium bacteremicum]MCV7432999.1 TetR/AcrR family transcriptional regulator [Mycolicibacterium bacteremicum]ORA03327.1 TetR family transcriptional regulator [Mycolicibacterium bacteremicum]